MKVNIISASDSSGGAARAAYRLHECFKLSGDIKSEMFVNQKLSYDSSVIEVKKNLVVKLLHKLASRFLKIQFTTNKIFHSMNLFGSSLFKISNKNKSDIVNIHWVNNEAITIKQFSMYKSPVVVTLHDMWAFCGAEHYVVDNDFSRFKIGYDNEIINSEENIYGVDINKFIWKRKFKYWNENLVIVTGSSWLSKKASESIIFQRNRIYTIPNALDVNYFNKMDKNEARSRLELPLDKFIIGFGAVSASLDPRKGFDLLVEALQYLDSNKNYYIAVFGTKTPNDSIHIDGKYFGNIDDEKLLDFYNAIDVMIVPSRQDHMPQTGTEAQSCGTPVVGFDTSGLPDIVEHKVTGYLANSFDVQDLAHGIIWSLKSENLEVLGKNARARAKKLWSYEKVNMQYKTLFESLSK